MDYLNDILAALSTGLDTLFPGIPVFAEEIPQELPERCFLTGFAGEVETAKEIGERYLVSGNFDITYLAPSKDTQLEVKRELNRVAALLSTELGVIRYNQMVLRLRGHRCHVDENELHDICGFAAYLYRLDHTPAMDKVKVGKMVVKKKGEKSNGVK